jgi:hypothetical protein
VGGGVQLGPLGTAVKLDMIDNKNNKAEAMTVCVMYITEPDPKLRLSMLYPASTVRNVV